MRMHWFASFVAITTLLAPFTLVGQAPAAALPMAGWAAHGQSAGVTQAALDNPLPTVSQLDPDSAAAGGTAFTLTVNGVDFVRGAVVRWNGGDRGTAFLSSSQLQATIVAADIASAGTALVTVFNPPPGGGTSNAMAFTINNPLPLLHSLSPASVLEGTPAFTLTCYGGNFVWTSVLRWGGEDRQTTFVSANQLRAAIAATDVATAGTVSVTVFNPPPGGGASNPAPFGINHRRPVLAEIDPPSGTAGGTAFTLTVHGADFVADSVVRWNGADRATAFVSGSQLVAGITAADIHAPGTAGVTVFTPAPGGGTSNARAFTITYPRPTITHLEPRWARAGGVAFTLTVHGRDFYRGAVVQWNGSARATSFLSNSQLQATITMVDIAAPGTAYVTVLNPAPGGGASNEQSFRVYGRVLYLFFPLVAKWHPR